MIQERGDKHSHRVYPWNKVVLIILVATCFAGELQLNTIGACSFWFSSIGGLRKD